MARDPLRGKRGMRLHQVGVAANHPAGAVGTGNPLPVKENMDPLEAESETPPLQMSEHHRTAAQVVVED